MAKRDVWVRVGDELVRGDTIVGITVHGGRVSYQSYKLLLKVTGHRDHLVIDTGMYARGDEADKDEAHEQATQLADDFVNTIARGAALPAGALVRLSSEDEGDDDGARWELTALGCSARSAVAPFVVVSQAEPPSTARPPRDTAAICTTTLSG
ncbi:hypothetical protein ACFV4X_12340 [Streptomyces ardesiacus]|uniref:hypothetical protein n=1 Tax=Streptomyces ardesiacus TaxID=285564 RepID=UPI00365249AC